jgi:hypothetical protein
MTPTIDGLDNPAGSRCERLLKVYEAGGANRLPKLIEVPLLHFYLKQRHFVEVGPGPGRG